MGPAKSMWRRDQGESGTSHQESVDLQGDLDASWHLAQVRARSSSCLSIFGQ